MTISLTIGAALLLTNIWLMIRCGQVRIREQVSVGDGGNEMVVRRMRAHSNFTESAPLVLILIAMLEYSGGEQLWLWLVAIAYVLGRIAHGFGMDGAALAKGRTIGTILTLLTQVGLAAMAIWTVYSKIL